MTDQRLNNILDLLESLYETTTKGVWFETTEAIGSPQQENQALLLKCDQSVTMNEDAEFVVEAHKLLPELITCVKRLQAKTKKLEQEALQVVVAVDWQDVVQTCVLNVDFREGSAPYLRTLTPEVLMKIAYSMWDDDFATLFNDKLGIAMDTEFSPIRDQLKTIAEGGEE